MQTWFGFMHCPECCLRLYTESLFLISKVPIAARRWIRIVIHCLVFSSCHEKHVLLLEVEKEILAGALENLSSGTHALFPGWVFLALGSNLCAEYWAGTPHWLLVSYFFLVYAAVFTLLVITSPEIVLPWFWFWCRARLCEFVSQH